MSYFFNLYSSTLNGVNKENYFWCFYEVQQTECVSKIHGLKFNPHCDGIWKWDIWKMIKSWGWSLHEWEKYPNERGLRELPYPFCKMRTEWPGSRASSDIEFAGAWILDFSGSRAMTNKFLFFIHHIVYTVFYLQKKNELRCEN